MSLWFYQDADGTQVGPVANDAFRNLREIGKVRDTTLIWRTGWSEWTTFAEIWLRGNPPEIEQQADGAAGDGTLVTKACSAVRANPTPPRMRLERPVRQQEFRKIAFAKCSLCRQQWPEHLLFGNRRLYVCAPCLKAHEQKRQERQRFRARGFRIKGGILNWAIKLLIVGMTMGGILVFFFHYMKGVSE